MPKRRSPSPALQGFVYRDQPRGPRVPGMLVQAPGTFAFRLLDLRHAVIDTESAALVDALGIPRTAHVYFGKLDPPEGWPGMYYELVGTAADATDPPDAPAFLDQFSYPQPLIIRPWRRRVGSPASPLVLEVRWAPSCPETMAIYGVEQDPSLADLQVIRDALTMVAGVRGVGRRQGTRYWTREAFHAAWPEKTAAVLRHRDGPPRLEDLARAYGVSPATFSRYLRDYGRPSS